jgi:hypothetical protein
MTIEDRLEKMKGDALEMAKYYYKGFGNTIQSILANAENHLLREGDYRDFDSAYRWFKEIKDFYSQIPFEGLNGKEEYYPLFVVNRLLPNLREKMDLVFVKNQKDELRNLQTVARTIVEVGRLYFDSLRGLLREIRSYPEARDFRIKIVDYKSDAFYF